MVKSKGFIAFIIIVICLVGAFCAYLIWAYYHYADHVPPGTYLAGEDVGGYTLDEAKQTGQKIYDSIIMDLTLLNDSSVASAPAITKTLTANDLGIAFEADVTAQSAMDAATDELFITRVNPFTQKNIGLSIIVDDGAITDKIKEYFKDAVFKNKLPKVKYNKKEKAFIVTPGIVGTMLDTDRFLTELKAGVLRGGESEYDVHLSSFPPNISDEAANAAKSTAEKAVKAKISFLKDDKVAYKAPKNSKASWITFTADEPGGKYDVGVDKDKVAKFLKTTASANLVEEPLPRLVVKEIDMESAEKESAEKAKKKAKEKKESDADDEADADAKTEEKDADDSADTDNDAAETVKEPAPKKARVVREGEEGLAIANRKQLATEIEESMLAFKSIELTPEYETIPFETEEIGSDFGKWIETNLSQQRTYLWNGNKKLKTYIVSTGKDVTPTITGSYEIYMKRDHHDMKGYDKIKKKDYVQPDVRYISYFTGAYAYHAAYWHNAFGTQVSHGCINMKTAEAKYLYEWAPIGTTCFIHY
jgi:hypothetical protein